MKILCLPRGCGKTHSILLEAYKSNAYIVVPTITQKNCLIKENLKLYKNDISKKIYTFQDVLKGKMSGIRGDIIIDNADEILKQFFIGNKLRLITMTKDNE